MEYYMKHNITWNIYIPYKRNTLKDIYYFPNTTYFDLFYCKSQMAQMVKSLPVVWETWGWEDPLVKGMATYSSIHGQRSLVGYTL